MIPQRAQYIVLEVKDKIAYLEDVSKQAGCATITNDAENVYHIVRQAHKVNRVVYKCTDGSWWEISMVSDAPGHWRVAFAPWHGLAWDILKRK